MNNSPTILLCEDSHMDVELTLNALSRFQTVGSVDVVRDGVEALDYLRQEGPFAERRPGNPALVLLDLKMPRIDGLEVLRTMKADPRLKNTPVVILTSSRQDRDLAASYEAGANAYVVKPVDAQKFALVVEQTGVFWTRINEPAPAPVEEASALADPLH